MTIKTENQIWTSVFTVLNKVLTKNGITGWTIMQGEQPTVENMRDKSIYITRLASRRYGWQAHRNKFDETKNKMVHSEEYFQENLFQISAFCKRNPSDITQITSSDILNEFITFFHSIDGVKEMHANGFQSFRIFELREPTITDDSDMYEKLPSFDISFVLVQNKECDVGYTDKYKLRTLKGI